MKTANGHAVPLYLVEQLGKLATPADYIGVAYDEAWTLLQADLISCFDGKMGGDILLKRIQLTDEAFTLIEAATKRTAEKRTKSRVGARARS